MQEVETNDKMHIYMVILVEGKRDIEVLLNSSPICCGWPLMSLATPTTVHASSARQKSWSLRRLRTLRLRYRQ